MARIGPYTFRLDHWGYHGVFDRDDYPDWSQRVGFTLDVGVQGDVGPNGRFPDLFPFEIRNVQDVINHHDQICAAPGELADHPEALHFEDPGGSSVTYAIRR